MSRNTLIQRLHDIIHASELIGPEHEAYYELLTGIEQLIADLSAESS